MKQIEKLTLVEVEKLLNTSHLKKSLILIAEERFGIPTSGKNKEQLRGLIRSTIEHERSMKAISEMASK